jgi:hypothetical protein
MGRWVASCTSIREVRGLNLSRDSSEILTSTPHHKAMPTVLLSKP